MSENVSQKKYLKFYQKLAYGAGDLASNCSYGLVSSFVLLYLTSVMGMNSAVCIFLCILYLFKRNFLYRKRYCLFIPYCIDYKKSE